MKISATRLRHDLYNVLDRVLRTGEAVEVERDEGTIEIRPTSSGRAARKKKPGRGNPHLVVGDPDDLVHFDWSAHWKPFL